MVDHAIHQDLPDIEDLKKSAENKIRKGISRQNAFKKLRTYNKELDLQLARKIKKISTNKHWKKGNKFQTKYLILALAAFSVNFFDWFPYYLKHQTGNFIPFIFGWPEGVFIYSSLMILHAMIQIKEKRASYFLFCGTILLIQFSGILFLTNENPVLLFISLAMNGYVFGLSLYLHYKLAPGFTISQKKVHMHANNYELQDFYSFNEYD